MPVDRPRLQGEPYAICLVVMMGVRSLFCVRNVEDRLHERGIEITPEASVSIGLQDEFDHVIELLSTQRKGSAS